jgi:hypothetical protein
MNSYPETSIVEFRSLFQNESGQAVDPTNVYFAYRVTGLPASAPISYNPGDATVPAVGVIARIGVGRYSTWVDTTGVSGVLNPSWTSTGVGQAANVPGDDAIEVVASGL